MMKTAAILFTAAMALAACSTDSYDTGTGTYSLTQADFVEAHSAASGGAADYVTTDDGATLVLSAPVEAKWMTRPDSLYRAVLFYNLCDEHTAEAVSLSQVTVLKPRTKEELEKKAAEEGYTETFPTDPVTFESMWTGSNGKYINMGLLLKNGQSDNESALHTIGIVADSLADNPDGTRTAFMHFYHDQGGVPEYYSSKIYVSVAAASIDADTLVMSINTYNGIVERRLNVPQ
ncbi:MAG: hypothetical protein ACI4TW_04060 [Prevotella sp.]